MKNHTTFVRMRSGDHLGDTKMSKRGTSLHRIIFLNRHKQKWLSQTQRKWADKQNFASDLLVFAPRLTYDFSKFSDNFTPFVQR